MGAAAHGGGIRDEAGVLAAEPQRATIFALATPPGRGALAIVRASGPAAHAGVATLLPPGARALPPPRVATRARLQRGDDPLDDALVLLFPGPHSVTGEDVAELHLHGSPAVVSAVLDACGRLPGWRPAGPGEFTRRAVHAGKLDLTAAEGLADLLAAETPAQRRQALAQAGGALARLYESWQRQVLRCLAHAEAVVDFGEEAHLSASVMDDVVRNTRELHDTLAAHLGSGAVGTGAGGGVARSYELASGGGVRVTLGGSPNAGKSSLFNALLGRDAAIVAPTAGTTRDVLTHGVALGPDDTAVALSDTAGLRAAGDVADAIEAQGMGRAAAALRDAHVRVLVIDAAAVVAGAPSCVPHAEQWAPPPQADGTAVATVVVLNKADLLDVGTRRDVARILARLPRWVQALCQDDASGAAGPWVVSTTSGEGLDRLTLALARAAAAAAAVAAGGGGPASSAGHTAALLVPAVTRTRHAHALRTAVAHLNAAVQAGTRSSGGGGGGGGADGTPPARDELMAEELRAAHAALCTVVGRAHCTEDVLDVVFADFCIGK